MNQELTPVSGSEKGRHKQRRLGRRHPGSDIDWIPETSELGTEIGYFPWLLTQGSDSEKAPVNPKYLDRIDDARALSVYGEWNPETDLSTTARLRLQDVRYAFDQMKKQLVKTGGQIQELPAITGKTFDDYMEHIAHTVTDRREFRYIMNQIKLWFDELGEEWKRVVTQPIEPPAEKITPEPWVHPRTASSENALSAGFIVNLAVRGIRPLALEKPASMPLPDEDTRVSLPMPPPDIRTKVSLPPPISYREPIAAPAPTPREAVKQAPAVAEAPQQHRTPTDIIHDELVTEGLIDPKIKLTPITIVTMKRIREAAQELGGPRKDLYEMVNAMKLDPGIDDDDIRILNLFTDNLLRGTNQ